MIALVEGAKRQKTPNEIALDILLAAMTIIFPAGLRHAAAVFAVQREGGRARGRRSRSPCSSRCSSA
jgi:K+-transporting ATPase ATPase B chain